MYSFPNSFWAYDIKFKNHIITTRGSDILISYKKLFSKTSLRQSINNTFVRKKMENSFNKAKYITATSVQQINVINLFVKDSDKIKLIRTGINFNLFLGEKTMLNKDFILFSPRSMDPLYNIDSIVRAFYLINKSYHTYNLKLIVINDQVKSPYFEEIKKMIKSKNLESKVIITNKLSQQEMAEYYHKSHLSVMYPSSDGTPNSALESMAALLH